MNDYHIKNEDNNYIISEIIIKDEDVNKDIRILNSHEEYLRIYPGSGLKDKIYNNENEIKKCEIYINDELIPFNYVHKFKTKGKYKLTINIKKLLKNTSLMFFRCSFLTSLDFSNFNTNNVTNMSSMFSRCKSLTEINLSNFNTQNVKYMSWMFYECSSLTNINLSNFNTNNVIDMNDMFANCSSLTKLNNLF